ncbi:MAG: hypothetical protein ACYDER_11650 [Ktedonobacteraceae bacterium]
MKTNESLRSTLMKVAEDSIEQLVVSMQEVKEGALQYLEQHILTSSLALGQKCLEQILEQQAQQQGSAARREGSCGHRQRLVSRRGRQVLTLLGPITIQRAYYQCLRPEESSVGQQDGPCSHGEAPFDQQWGLSSQHSSPGLQKLVSSLSASLTQAEVAEAISRVLPLALSARQVRNITQPVGAAFLHREDAQAQDILQRGAEKRSREAAPGSKPQERIERMYVEMDGMMPCVRRGSVPMDTQEQEGKGDVYREATVGAVFVGERGPERSELVPGVFLDTPGPIRYVARRTTAEEFAALLYALADSAGIAWADHVVVLGDGAKWNLAAGR